MCTDSKNKCESEVTNEADVKDAYALCQFLLEQAIQEKDLESARDLILVSNDITFDQELAYRLLRLAVELENEQYVSDLIYQIPNLNTHEGGELVWLALSYRNAKIATMLVEAGADLDVRKPGDPKRQTLLQKLAGMRNNRREFYDLALLMMDLGADVNAANQVNNTALHYAASPYKHPDKYSFVLAVELVHRGARIETTNHRGYSVVDIAVQNCWFEGQLCPLLIAMADVDDDTKCRWILQAIITVTEEDGHSAMGLSSLLELGFPILKLENLFTDVWKPLCFAVVHSVVHGKAEQLEILLEHGLDINAKFTYYDNITTALHVALHHNYGEIANSLIARGADIHAIDDATREQPIHAACRSNSIENVRLLLRLGVDINIADSAGKTPYSMINPSCLSDPLREVLVEQFAILTTKGIKINNKDWRSLRAHPGMLRYYRKCLNELQKMETVKINHGISLFSLLIENVENVSYYARNAIFAENFHKNKQQMKVVFPVYFRELAYVVKMAEKRRDIFLSKEEALSDVLQLPQLVVTKIAGYASFDELIDFEKLYHISMRKMRI